MPDNNNNNLHNLKRSYGGKEYSIFDIQNLKEANKQMEQQILHQEDFIRKTQELIKKKKEVSDLDKNIMQRFIENNKELNKQLDVNNEKLNDMTHNWNRYITSTMKSQQNSQQLIQSIIAQGNQNNKPLPKSISDLFRQSMTDIHNAREEKAINNIYQKVADSVTAKYKRQGADFTDAETIQKMNKEIQDETLKKSEKIVGKFSKGADWINVAANTFSSAVNIWAQIFKLGLNNQTSVYEKTFENISVRNGTTRSTYYGAQSKLNNQLSDLGVRNNIASSEVQQMWNTWATNGVKVDLSNAEQTASAIETVITQHIVPFLDTTSRSFTILNNRLDDKFVKNIRGINEYSMQVAGNSYLTGDLMEEIIDQVQPMSDEALQNLTQGSTEFAALINTLTPKMGEKAAKEYATQLFKMQNYSDQIMRSGSVFEKDWLIKTINSPYNLYEPSDWNNITGLGVDTAQTYSSWLPGYTSTVNGLVTNVGAHKLGLTTEQTMGAYNLTASGLTGSGIANKTDMTPAMLAEYNKIVTNRFTEDQNQTNTQLQNITVENFMNELAVVNEWLGNWAGVIETAIKGIGIILMTKLIGGVIGKGIGLLSGVGGATATASSGGLFASLGAAGPIGLGIAAVGASVAAGVAIGNKMLEIAGKEQGEAKNDYAAQYQSKGYDTSSSNTLGKVHSITSYDRGSFLGQYKNNLSGDEKDALGINRSIWLSTWDEIGNTKGKAWDNQQWYKYNNMAWLRSGFAFNVGGDILDDKMVLGSAILYAIALDQMGMLGTTKDTNPLLNWGAEIKSKEDIGNAIRVGIAEGLFTGWSNIHAAMWLLSDDDAGPRDLKGNLYGKDITSDILTQYGFNASNEQDKYFMSHRQGLDYVPYDEYPAMLHEGEAVLTATTANELRNLLNEYRQTNQQAVNFDTIIQQQTSDLVYKMDEIISAIGGANVNTANYNENQGKTILRNSLSKIKSTKSF